ncbi:iron-sulfur cluster assembly scaffold protein [Hirschia baltica]|uniref:Nitrogen-fixing NifU domain protein n=1 Tax=Hirschia baltica (strain ATCC 49814 / DSM 5838 / IFAM 1418) TaxID=582402 RepID=C6XNB0_HIRBI|nr:iron-sulfur cluster assembly scaffold protein [Hirschia baltica]ACT60054.1 nitrogen-fixing NifU domain protein [Hirschia baltica ATCC 49814]
MFDEIYHNRVLELAANIPNAERLANPDGSARKVSRVCGSVITADVNLDSEGKITDIGFEPEACVLGQTSCSVLSAHAKGKNLADIVAIRDAFKAMLKEGAPPPEGDFWELRHLEGVRDYPQRHTSTLLAFEALIAAMEAANEKQSANS